MTVDSTLKDLLQLCADLQDGFFEAATHVEDPDLSGFFQATAVQWNEFADKVFHVLVSIDHTSPNAKWNADIHRPWMNPRENLDALDEPAICQQCVDGLRLGRRKLDKAATAIPPQLRDSFRAQTENMDKQLQQLLHYVEDTDRRSV